MHNPKSKSIQLNKSLNMLKQPTHKETSIKNINQPSWLLYSKYGMATTDNFQLMSSSRTLCFT